MVHLIKQSAPRFKWSVTATVYHAVESQTDSTPLVTADGSKINPGNPQRWIAVSRDLEKYFQMGDTVIVTGAGHLDGEWVIHDRMNKRWSNKIDLLVKSGLGKWENVLIQKKFKNKFDNEKSARYL